jgi:hypothetical protein
VNCGERGVRIVGRAIGERGQSELSTVNRSGDRFQRPDFRSRQPKPRQACRTGAQNRRRVEGIESGGQPAPNCGGAGRRQLLRHNNGGKPRKAAFAPP